VPLRYPNFDRTAAAQALDDRVVLGEARDCMLEALVPLGRWEELEPLLNQLIDEKSKELGADHPVIADYLLVRVTADLRHNKLAEARTDIQRVLDIRRRVYPPNHFKIIEAMHNLAAVAEAEGKPNEMLEINEQALAMTDPTHPEQMTTIVGLLIQLGMHEANSHTKGDHAKAIEHLERAADLIRKQSGSNSIELAIVLINYGQVKSEDNIDAAFGILGEARAILDRNHDKRAASVGVAMAIVAINKKRYADARKFAEDVLAHPDPDDPPQQVAMTKQLLARALVETHGDRTRAHQLALEARQVFVKLGPGGADKVKELDAWLAKH